MEDEIDVHLQSFSISEIGLFFCVRLPCCQRRGSALFEQMDGGGLVVLLHSWNMSLVPSSSGWPEDHPKAIFKKDRLNGSETRTKCTKHRAEQKPRWHPETKTHHSKWHWRESEKTKHYSIMFVRLFASYRKKRLKPPSIFAWNVGYVQ